MNLADKPCYPCKTLGEKVVEWQGHKIPIDIEHSGLTFRERLIIALASNYWMFEPSSDKSPELRIIDTADAIIKEMK